MAFLTRKVRFSPDASDGAPGRNGYGGVPAIRGLGRHYELEVICRGEPDPTTGYVRNIKDIDHAVRDHALDIIRRAIKEGREPAGLLPELVSSIGAALGSPPAGLVLWLSPYHGYEMSESGTVLIRQKFDFAAAHRLWVAGWTDEANQSCFGRCMNPNGHGHNYQLETCVETPLRDRGAPALSLDRLETIVDDRVIRRFDHRNLNLDVEEFRDGTGLLPTVENIARVCFTLLDAPLRETCAGCRLRWVTVWETDRTSARYPG